VVLNEMRHAKSLFRLLVYLPVMVPPVVTAILWKWFYDPGQGLFNEVLRALHLPTSSWVYSTGTAVISLVLVSTWSNMGSTVLVYLAALQGIPADLYEAAELDGANIFQRVRHVTVPQTRYVLLMLMLLQIVATMQVFTEPFIITGGGPQDATISVLYLIYKYAFVYFNYGGACALSIMLFVFLGIFSAFYLRLTRTND
jgi:multiple sugar transport system permease protein